LVTVAVAAPQPRVRRSSVHCESRPFHSECVRWDARGELRSTATERRRLHALVRRLALAKHRRVVLMCAEAVPGADTGGG
jgi:hypothetical protein